MRKYNRNFCTECKRELPSENFSKKWSKFQNKYLLASKCKECLNKKTKIYRKSNLGQSAFKNYLSEGHYGWTTKWENDLMRYGFRYTKDENIWQKKLTSIVTLNSYDYMGDRNIKIPISDDERRAKLIKGIKSTMLKKKLKMNYYNILGEGIMMRCMSTITRVKHIKNLNIWENKFVFLIRGYKRRKVRL